MPQMPENWYCRPMASFFSLSKSPCRPWRICSLKVASSIFG